MSSRTRCALRVIDACKRDRRIAGRNNEKKGLTTLFFFFFSSQVTLRALGDERSRPRPPAAVSPGV